MEDILNQKFGNLTVVSLHESIKNIGYRGSTHVYNCLCDCGNLSQVRRGNLKNGHTRSCGCIRGEFHREKMRAENDLTGLVFGRLTVLGRDPKKFKRFICECECGEVTSVVGNQLKISKTTSCGCLKREQSSVILKQWHRDYRSSLGLDPDTPIGAVEDLDRATFRETMQFSILKRDSFRCSWCSATGVYLQVHHLETWKNSPDKRYDRNNVVTLCTECHKNIHQRDYHKPTDPVMTILLQGYANEVEDGYFDKCARIELTPN